MTQRNPFPTLLCAALLFGAGPAARAGDLVAVGPEFQVNSVTAGSQRFPALTALAGGGFVVAWDSESSAGGDASSFSVQARRYASDATPLGGQFQVNTTSANRQRFPSIAPRSDAGFVILWDSDASAGSDVDGLSIQARRYTLVPRCGDEDLDAGEECDDGNLVSGDGCSASCEDEGIDSDGDGIPDPLDACPTVPFQDDSADADGDGRPDACDCPCVDRAALFPTPPLACYDVVDSGLFLTAVTSSLGTGIATPWWCSFGTSGPVLATPPPQAEICRLDFLIWTSGYGLSCQP